MDGVWTWGFVGPGLGMHQQALKRRTQMVASESMEKSAFRNAIADAVVAENASPEGAGAGGKEAALTSPTKALTRTHKATRVAKPSARKVAGGKSSALHPVAGTAHTEARPVNATLNPFMQELGLAVKTKSPVRPDSIHVRERRPGGAGEWRRTECRQ